MTFMRLWQPPKKAWFAQTAKQRYLWNRSIERAEKRGDIYITPMLNGELGRIEGIRFIETIQNDLA